MIVLFSFFWLLVNCIPMCYAMELAERADTWCYQHREFTIEVKKTGEVHSLTRQDKKKIKAWLKAKKITREDEIFIKTSIFAFIHAHIKFKPEVIDAIDQRYKTYRFRLFEIRKNDTVFKATVDHCSHVAHWLAQNGLPGHVHEKDRIKIVNHGPYLSLRAKNIEPYKTVIPQNKDRQALLENNKLIALLSTIEYSKDVTDEASLKPTLQFHFARHSKNN